MERQAQQRGGGFTVTPLMRGDRINRGRNGCHPPLQPRPYVDKWSI